MSKSYLPLLSKMEMVILSCSSGIYAGTIKVINEWAGIKFYNFLLYLINGMSLAISLTLGLFLFVRGEPLTFTRKLCLFALYVLIILNHDMLVNILGRTFESVFKISG